MKRFLYSLKIFWIYSLMAFKESTQDRTGILLFGIGKLIRFVILFFFVFFIVRQIGSLKGYGVNQVIFFYLTYNLVDAVGQFLFREVYRFRWRFTTGQVEGILTKPYHPFLRILVGGVDFIDLLTLIPYVILAVYFALKLPTLSGPNIFFYFLLIGNSLILITAFHIIALALALYTTNASQFVWIYRDLISFGRFPINIYQEPIRSILTFAIPIGIIMTFPVQALLGILEPQFIVVSFFFAAVFLLIAFTVWDASLKKFQGWSG